MGHAEHSSTNRLAFEQLEPRALLAANGIFAGFGFPVGFSVGQVPALFGPTAVFANGGLTASGQSSGAVGFIPGVGLPGGNTGLGFNLTLPEGISVSAAGTSGVVAILNGTASATVGREFSSIGPDATTGVGQMTITTGAGTYGIGSFATPTNGISDKGGAGGMVPAAPSTDTQNDGNPADLQSSGTSGSSFQ